MRARVFSAAPLMAIHWLPLSLGLRRFSGTGIRSMPPRYRPVGEAGFFRISAGGPWATI